MQNRRTSLRPLVMQVLATSVAAACAAGDAGSALETIRLEAVQELRIGSVDDPSTYFTRFDHLIVAPDGRIYTAHDQEKLIRIHDAEGRLVRAFGREGSGPGEFRRLNALGLLGDTLWVFDSGNTRFSYFTLEGELTGHRLVTIDLGGPDRNPARPEGHFSDGTIRGEPPAWSAEVVAGRITETPILRVDEKGTPLDTVAIQHWVNTPSASGTRISPTGGGSTRSNRTRTRDWRASRRSRRKSSMWTASPCGPLRPRSA